MENKVAVNNNGIDSAGITKDYQQAVSEFIWNGFDANASIVNIEFDANAIDNILEVRVIDNGKGIAFENLTETFGSFLDSIKKISFQKSSYIRGHKGKGRYSFVAMAGKAIWHTAYIEEGSQKCLEYDITITGNTKDVYTDDNRVVANHKNTGTTVRLLDLFGVTAYNFYCDDFKSYLAKQFGWFLFLNKDRNFALKINGEEISYNQTIAESDIAILKINDERGKSQEFKITFLRWNDKIGDKFYFYFLNSEVREVAKELTSFNNNAIGFYHSVYVESTYFDAFNPNDTEQSGNLFEANKHSLVFKGLMGELQRIVKDKQKLFIRGEAAEKLIISYEREGVIPKFKNNKYDNERRNDLLNVIRNIYCIEPKIFQGLNKEQQKVTVGLFNLLLDTDERDTILELIGQIVSMTTEERQEFALVLKKTTVSNISRTIALIENRFKIVELLKILVFDLKKFTNERDNIQKVIEENYWLFGEQYSLISANESFDTLLEKYIQVLNKGDKRQKIKIGNIESNRRPDIFICRKQMELNDINDDLGKEENVIVELKRPDVSIGKDQLRQIEDYLDLIINEDQFNSSKRSWKFYAISNQLDSYTVQQLEAFKDKGKRHLVKAVKNYELYAMTWDDVFLSFNLRHKFIVDKLGFDLASIKEELKSKGIEFSKDSATTITHKIIDLKIHQYPK